MNVTATRWMSIRAQPSAESDEWIMLVKIDAVLRRVRNFPQNFGYLNYFSPRNLKICEHSSFSIIRQIYLQQDLENVPLSILVGDD